jgi:hypothetical protein
MELVAGGGESVAQGDVGGRPAAIEDDGPGPGLGQRAGQEEERGDAPSAADEERFLTLEMAADGEALSQRPDDVERVARSFQGQERGTLPGDLEEELDPRRPGVVDAERAAQEREGPFGDLDHDELPRPGLPAEGGGVDDETVMVAPALDLAEAGVSFDGHGGSGLVAPVKITETEASWQPDCSPRPAPTA